VVLRRGLAAAGLFCVATAAAAAPVSDADVRAAMQRTEALMGALGIDVSGYARSPLPPVELVPAGHPYVQGNDGGYVAGHVYLNREGAPACTDLALLHELVHDATVKHDLFAHVSNDKVRDMFEALADAVTAIAAEEPYRPGCLPRRAFDVDTPTLVALASPQPEPTLAQYTVSDDIANEPVIYVFFAHRSAVLSPEARRLIELAAERATAAGRATIVCAEVGDVAASPKDAARALAVQRALQAIAPGAPIEILHHDGNLVTAAREPVTPGPG
jgi:hypothetical protein